MAVKPFDVTNLGKAAFFDPKEMGYRDSLDIIKDESVKVQKSFVKIGWYLKHIRDNELYMEDGYANVYECAAAQLGYSQSTVSRFINICEKFSKGQDSPELDEKYEGFDKSQMIEMLPLDQEQLEKVTPDMPVKKIRDIKKADKKNWQNGGTEQAKKKVEQQEPTENGFPGQTSIEEDFPEYMPDTDDDKVSDLPETDYATSHKEQNADKTNEDRDPDENIVVDATYKEMVTLPWKTTQSELPVLKNNDQRKEWLKKYQDWGLWYRDLNIDVNYYKFDFNDGSRLVVAEYPQRHSYYSDTVKNECYYHLLKKNKKGYGKTYDEKYRHQTDSETELVEFLKNLQRKDK